MASSTLFFSRNFFARSRFLLTSAAICLGLPLDYIFLLNSNGSPVARTPHPLYTPPETRPNETGGMVRNLPRGCRPFLFYGKLEVQHGKVSSRVRRAPRV